MSGSPTCLMAGELERSEDYTGVICRGANPRTTHIFDDCVVGLSEKESVLFFIGEENQRVSLRRDESFLRLCSSCRKKLEIGTDIYMFKGEKAFCSEECRSEEMSKSGRDEFCCS
ncbi:hypothetical protein QQ045_006824 [Rhodiola kirilowii]